MYNHSSVLSKLALQKPVCVMGPTYWALSIYVPHTSYNSGVQYWQLHCVFTFRMMHVHFIYLLC